MTEPLYTRSSPEQLYERDAEPEAPTTSAPPAPILYEREIGPTIPEPSVVRPPGMPKDPFQGPVGAINSTIQGTASWAKDYTKAVTGPFLGVGKLGLDLLDWHTSSYQNLFNPDIPVSPNPIMPLAEGIVQTVKEDPLSLLFSSAKGFREEGPGYALTGKGAGEVTGDLAGNLMLLPGLVRAGSLARRIPGAAPVMDRIGSAVIPKYDWTDAMYAAEAANEGRKMAGGAGLRNLLDSGAPNADLAAVITENNRYLLARNVDPNQLVNRVFPAGPMTAASPRAYMAEALHTQLHLMNNFQLARDLFNMGAADGRPLLQLRTSASRTGMGADYVRVPPGADFMGPWRGAWVHPDIVDILPTLSRPREVEGFLRQYMHAWKTAKTTLSPTTHLNNTFGDVMFAHLAGNNPFNPANAGFYKQAAEDLAGFARTNTPSPTLTEAMSSGSVRPGFARVELGQPRPANPTFGRVMDSDAVRGAGQLYDMEDQLFRYATYLKQRSGGATAQQASIEINKRFPSYSVTSPLGQELRGQGTRLGAAVGSPFTSFGFEAMRIYKLAAQEHPGRVMALGALPAALTMMNLKEAGLTIEDWEQMKAGMPSHMRGKVLIPFPSSKGGIEVADWSNIVPLAGIDMPGSSPADAGPARDFLFGGPAWNLVKLGFNYARPGQAAVDEAKGEGWSTTGVWKGTKAVAPVPGFVTTGAERVPQAVMGLPPRKQADVESIPQAAWFSLFPTFDAKHEDELAGQGFAERKAKQAEGKRGLRGVNRDPTLGDWERERKKENVLDFIRRQR